MHNTTELVHEVLELDVQQLETSEACAEQLTYAATEANKMAAAAVGYGKMAIRYAIKAGQIMNRAKEILPHGEFLPWLATQLQTSDVAERTAYKWMKLAKLHIGANLMDNPDIRTITDAYRATGILPEPQPKEPSEEEEGEKSAFTLTLRTKFRHVSDWNEDAARDFLYEFEPIARLAVQLKTQFGI